MGRKGKKLIDIDRYRVGRVLDCCCNLFDETLDDGDCHPKKREMEICFFLFISNDSVRFLYFLEEEEENKKKSGGICCCFRFVYNQSASRCFETIYL